MEELLSSFSLPVVLTWYKRATLAQRLGVGQSTISNWLQYPEKIPQTVKLACLALQLFDAEQARKAATRVYRGKWRV